MSDERHVSPQQVADIAACNQVRPKETDFIGRPGYKRTYRKDGSYTWRCRFKPNDGHGKLTREGAEVGEIFKPFMRAEVERQMNSQPVGPALTDVAANQRGWSHARRAVGNRVERGIDGELWRATSDGLSEPTGRWCLGEPQPWATVPEGGNPDGTMKTWDSETYDAEGNMWTTVNGEQKMVEGSGG